MKTKAGRSKQRSEASASASYGNRATPDRGVSILSRNAEPGSLENHRTEAIGQIKVHALVDKSPQVRATAEWQHLADHSPLVLRLAEHQEQINRRLGEPLLKTDRTTGLRVDTREVGVSSDQPLQRVKESDAEPLVTKRQETMTRQAELAGTTTAAGVPPLSQLDAGERSFAFDWSLVQKAWVRSANRIPEHPMIGQSSPLPVPIKHRMEQRLSTNFGHVRVQEDVAVPHFDAFAYAQGDSIHFAPGKMDFSSESGLSILIHELAHVVQQRQGRVAAEGQENGIPTNRSAALEQEAEGCALEVMQGHQTDLGPAAIECRSPGVAQFGKTKKHDKNWEKRAKQLTAPLKKDANFKIQFQAKRKALKAIARVLDDPSVSATSYKQYKTGGVFETDWLKLEQTTSFYRILKEANKLKEKIKYRQRIDNQGRSMEATILAGKVNLMVGSNTGDTATDYYWGSAELKKRKNSSRSALYVAGHLLNDNMGGTGRPFNLVPLTAEKTQGNGNKTGSNDANGYHNKQVEEPLKKILGKPAEYESVWYYVESVSPASRPPRPETKIVKQFADEFNTELQADPTLSTKDIQNNIAVNHAVLPDIINASWQEIERELITAVGGHSNNPSTLEPKLQANAALWQLEDRNIPQGIKCSATYKKTAPSGGNIGIPTTKSGVPMTNFDIPNVLPTKYTAPFRG